MFIMKKVSVESHSIYDKRNIQWIDAKRCCFREAVCCMLASGCRLKIPLSGMEFLFFIQHRASSIFSLFAPQYIETLAQTEHQFCMLEKLSLA